MTAPVLAGGFDPVPIVAQAGDSIDVVVTDASGATVYHTGAAVAAARRPVIVRTEPPPKKRDVPLNASVVIDHVNHLRKIGKLPADAIPNEAAVS